jgi:sporulation protein YlmC with PRC-barrel domain
MTSEQIRQRSDILGTQVITRDTGKRLGIVSQMWVDIDRREVVALGLRENLLAIGNMPRAMLLSRICQIGDVILVDDESVLDDDVDVEAYSPLINSEVITETGEPLGRVRGFKFDTEDGKVCSLIIGSLGIPQIPDRIGGFETLSTYELPVEDIVSSGPNRLIVFEGSEEKLVQLTVGVMERLGLGRAPWEDEDSEYALPRAQTNPANLLSSGEPVRTPVPPLKTNKPAEPEWDDDEWEEPAVAKQPLRRAAPAPEPKYFDDDIEEEENWSEATQPRDRASNRAYAPPERPTEKKSYNQEYDNYNVEEDAWADDESPQPYKPAKLNIPEKTKAPEYEEEDRY